MVGSIITPNLSLLSSDSSLTKVDSLKDSIDGQKTAQKEDVNTLKDELNVSDALHVHVHV